MKDRLKKDLLLMKQKTNQYLSKTSSFGIDAIDLNIEKLVQGSQKKLMWTTNHPTSYLLYKIAAEYIVKAFSQVLTDSLIIEASRMHSTNATYLQDLTNGFATILDQRSVSYRLIQTHQDTPYLKSEIGASWPIIDLSWKMGYTHYLYDKQADDMCNWRQF